MESKCSSGNVSFSQALRDKYIDSLFTDSSTGISFPTFGGGKRELEYARLEKLNKQLQCLENRTEIELRGCQISEIDKVEDVISKFRNVRILDLSFNRISSWEQVALVCDLFPLLEHLIITGNPLESSRQFNQIKRTSSFKKLKALTMGRLTYDWNQIHYYSRTLWPHIKYLDLFGNNISQITNSEKLVFDTLKTLILSQNEIIKWSYVEQLSTLPNLTELQLVQCSIEAISFSTNGTKAFPCLRHLDLKNNNLKSWRDLAELHKLPVLEELIVRGNPLFEDIHHDYAFNFTLSIVGDLKVLNRQEINPSLRNDGELHYLRHFFPKYIQAQEKNDQNFLEENPRYKQLLAKYGPPLDLLPTTAKTKGNLISLTLVDFDSGKKIVKKVSRRTTVSGLKVLVKRLLSIDDVQDIDVWYSGKTASGEAHEYLLDKEDYPLDFYSLEDADVLLIRSGK